MPSSQGGSRKAPVSKKSTKIPKVVRKSAWKSPQSLNAAATVILKQNRRKVEKPMKKVTGRARSFSSSQSTVKTVAKVKAVAKAGAINPSAVPKKAQKSPQRLNAVKLKRDQVKSGSKIKCPQDSSIFSDVIEPPMTAAEHENVETSNRLLTSAQSGEWGAELEKFHTVWQSASSPIKKYNGPRSQRHFENVQKGAEQQKPIMDFDLAGCE